MVMDVDNETLLCVLVSAQKYKSARWSSGVPIYIRTHCWTLRSAAPVCGRCKKYHALPNPPTVFWTLTDFHVSSQ